jgi:hypothetical protein
MRSHTSVTTQNPQPRRKGEACSKGTPAAYSDERHERPSRGPWPSDAPPTGVLMTGVLGELAFYYGAYWIHYRSAQHWGKTL